jgi:hypothetical protein
LNLANVEYVLLTQRISDPAFEEVFVGSRSAIYRNLNALPRAWLAGSIEVVDDGAAVDRLLAADMDARNTVLLPEPLPGGIDVQPDPQGTVTWGEREIDRYTIRVDSDRPALLVITDNYFPAWHAEIDGAAVPLLRANYAFRAVPVPAGSSELRLYYDSGRLNSSAIVSAVILLLLAGVTATGLRPNRKGSGPA